jgi:serine/threonine-protein kinase
MSQRQEDILGVAQAVADGTPVDWDRQLESTPEHADQLERLRSIEKVVVAFRATGTAARSSDATQARVQIREPHPHLPPSRWGSLEIRERLGEGAFGEVYRAHDPSLQRDVALKLLRSAYSGNARNEQRFINEARRLARVRHENVVVVHGADRHDERLGLWTDLVDGRTLEDCLNEQGPFGAREACLVGIDLCKALAAVHGAGLVHQDVKTKNIMRETGGRIVLMDFGAVRDRSVSSGPSRPGPLSGTPLFMAPELFRGADASVASDVYSLGVVLYRLVSGKFPVEASNFDELARNHERGSLPQLRELRPDLPIAFVKAVERALAKESSERFSTAGDFEHALVQALGAEPPKPAPKPLWQRWPVAAAAAIVLLFVGVLVVRQIVVTPLEIDVALYRAGDGVDERLTDGAHLILGDRLFLEIEGNREMYVYILNSDQLGKQYVLFPLPDLELKNPLAPEQVHRLPGASGHDDHYWGVSSAGGEETFLVIASRKPLDQLERRLESVPRAMAGTAFELDSDAIQNLRGIGGLVSEPRSNEQPLSGLYSDLTREGAQSKGIRVWQTRLNNPVE